MTVELFFYIAGGALIYFFSDKIFALVAETSTITIFGTQIPPEWVKYGGANLTSGLFAAFLVWHYFAVTLRHVKKKLCND